MDLHQFLSPAAESARRHGPQNRIVTSSRVRLARNLREIPFPNRAQKDDRIRALDIIQPAVQAASQLAGAFAVSMDSLAALDKHLLVERHLISREHAAKNAGSGLVLGRDETISVMINEEDHLRMQALLPGLQVQPAWDVINQLDSDLEGHLDYAFDRKLGYLTACPTNLGTGIRVSAMLHLPGLVLNEQIAQIIQSVNKLGLAVRGLYGEGTDAFGNIFQVSNQMTLGEDEPRILARLEKVIAQIMDHEENARGMLLEKKTKVLLNNIGRAYGALANAHSIASKEAMNLLSLLKLGMDLGLFPGVDRPLVDEIFLLSQPAHLQRRHSEKLSSEERDIYRADMIRESLAKVKRPLNGPPPPPPGN